MPVMVHALGDGVGMIAAFQHADHSSAGVLFGNRENLASQRTEILGFETERTDRVESMGVDIQRTVTIHGFRA